MNQNANKLWMGGILPDMSEEYILDAFRKMGHNPLSVKFIRDRNTGQQANYCFITFQTGNDAYQALSLLDRKSIPGTDHSRFLLRHAHAPGTIQRDAQGGKFVTVCKNLVNANGESMETKIYIP